MSASFKVSLEDDVSRNAKRAGKSVKDLGRDMRNVKGAARGSGVSFGWLSDALGAIKIAAGAAAIAIGAIGVKLGLSIGKSAAFMEQNRLAFGLLMHGAEAGGRALDEIRKVATDLNLPIKDTIKNYRKLLSMQFKPQAATDIIKLGADMQALGATTEEVGSIIRAMTQIKAKGKLQAEELTGQLAEAGVSAELVFKELGKTMGKTTDEVRKLITAGKVDADVALDAIKKAILVKLGTKAPGEAAEKFKSTLGGMWAGIKTQAESAIIDISDRLGPKLKEALSGFQLPDGAVRRIGDIGEKVLDVVASLKEFKLPPGMGKVADDLIERFDIVQTAIEQVKAAASGWLEGFSETWDSISPMVDKAVEAILEFSGSESGLADIKETFRDVGKIAAVGLGALVIALGLGTAAFRAFGRSYQGTKEGLDAIWIALEAAMDPSQLGERLGEGLRELGGDIISGIVDGITSGASEVTNAITNVATQAIQAAKDALEISSPSKVFAEMGRNIDRGLAGGVRAEQGLVAASTAQTVQAATSSAAGVTNHISARVSQGNQTFNVSGATSPKATAAAIQAIQLGDLATALEQLGASMGAAAT
jgi:tape measure domain-containing protein